MTKIGRLNLLNIFSFAIMLMACSPTLAQPIERPQVQTGQKTPWLFQYPSDKLPPAGQGLFKVRLIGPKNPLKNGPLQNITVSIASRDGQPASTALVHVTGRARDLRRFLPTTPHVLTKSKPGIYQIVGLRFNMTGRWLLEFTITQGKIRDKARLEVIVD